MLIMFHSQATTTPKIKAAIQASNEPAWVLAERNGTTEQTFWKWRRRDSVADRSHTPHRLQNAAEKKTIQWILFPPNADARAGGRGGGFAQGAADRARRPSGARHWA
jgi:hypothetical protein